VPSAQGFVSGLVWRVLLRDVSWDLLGSNSPAGRTNYLDFGWRRAQPSKGRNWTELGEREDSRPLTMKTTHDSHQGTGGELKIRKIVQETILL